MGDMLRRELARQDRHLLQVAFWGIASAIQERQALEAISVGSASNIKKGSVEGGTGNVEGGV